MPFGHVGRNGMHLGSHTPPSSPRSPLPPLCRPFPRCCPQGPWGSQENWSAGEAGEVEDSRHCELLPGNGNKTEVLLVDNRIKQGVLNQPDLGGFQRVVMLV
uniref:Uncharacterized protein n=1 Tax=Sphaerodactylus townsendi TaxID=933632 RepID=A0ACB8F6G5_9SAUR